MSAPERREPPEPTAQAEPPEPTAQAEPPEQDQGRSTLSSWGRLLARRGALALLLLGGIALGYLSGGMGARRPGDDHGAQGGHGAEGAHGAPAVAYTCSMHPQIRQPGPGKCPICGMDLIPATSGDTGGTDPPRELKLGADARRLAEIETSRVERRQASAQIRAVGKVAYDERRMGYLTTWVAGRIERLYVTFTGAQVRAWQPMVELYSPELVTAQMELLQALRMANALSTSKVGGLEGVQEATLKAVREKLRLLGLSAAQIRQIEQRGTPVDRLTIHAPLGGVVIEKRAQPQMYVQAGTRLYTIADLRKVWVKLEVYESEVAWVRTGQKVTFTAEAYPGQDFMGTVDFVDPYVSDRTRTVQVRLTVDNADGRLKPDMFVRAVLSSPLGSAGQSVARGDRKAAGAQSPLVIPASAPLLTGTRAVVYLEVEPGTYRGQEVKLGPRVGDHYVVLEGLKEGDRVVTRGAFKLDSALQIQARPSMMDPPRNAPASGDGATLPPLKPLEAPAAFRARLAAILGAYGPLHHGLSRDDLAAAKIAATALSKELATLRPDALSQEARSAWDALAKPLGNALGGLSTASDISAARRDFETVSDRLIEAIRRFGLDGKSQAIRFRCTMAFDNRGANWIQTRPGVENPYFGSQMFRCGDQHETLSAPGDPPTLPLRTSPSRPRSPR